MALENRGEYSSIAFLIVFFLCVKNIYGYARKWNSIIYGNVFSSSLMFRFTEDEFDSEQAITIGVDFKTKVVNLDGVNVKLGEF